MFKGDRAASPSVRPVRPGARRRISARAGVGDEALAAKVAFLARPQAYAGAPAPVVAHETHMSWVFLAGERAYKLKKPLRLDYLDFSTLARREAVCRAELRLNRRLAPDVYLDVATLRLGPHGLMLDGAGRVVDWLVVMRRLDPADTLEERLKNHVTDTELDRLAGRLVRFFRHAPPRLTTPAAQLSGWARTLAEDGRVLLDPRLDVRRGEVMRIQATLRRYMGDARGRLSRRIRAGRIVDGHGDLRPEHIWITGSVRIIDCLEFSAVLRANDPLDEIAFLDLECERLGAPDAGRRLRARMLAGLHERGIEPDYRFHRCRRALLRARLAIAHLLEASPRTPAKWPVLAQAYLRIASREASHLERWLNRRAGRRVRGAGATA